MPGARRPLVLFAAAAGPDMGFGHLVRCGVLADALDAPRELALRGQPSARLTALEFGWTVHCGRGLTRLLQPDLVVVDDPSRVHRERWVRAARRAGVPVAVIVDGDGAGIDADLIVDGSVVARPDARIHRCAGPSFAVLSPAVASRRSRPIARDARRVFVALGGGAHVRRVGAAIAQAIVDAVPGARVDVASGFTDAPEAPLPDGGRWIHAPRGLVDHLASAGAAVVAGGLTVYEACALGTPSVAVPMVDAQRPAVAALASAGAVLAVTAGRRVPSPSSVAGAVARVLSDRRLASALAARAARTIDGAGAARVAARLHALIRTHSGGSRHAA